jgi:glycosyltransferase involved in cell wall biosynthesis
MLGCLPDAGPGREVSLRVLMILLNQVGKGTYWRALYFGRILVKRGHQVTLMALSPRSRLRLREQDVDGVHQVETPDLLPGMLRSGWDAWDAFRRVLWLRGRSFDLVHAFESRPVVLWPALVAQRRGARLIMDWCDWFGRGGSVEERPNRIVRAVLRPVETFFEEHFRTRADGTLTINAFLRDRAMALGVRPESIEVIRNGSDTGIRPVDRLTARRAVGLPLDEPLIGYVGNIYTRDAELMARAFNRVQRAVPRARLVLVGYFNRNIEPLLTHPAAVIRTGSITLEQVHQYLAACDLCWLPMCDSGANRGRWPGKLNDYMAVGRPVVVTGVGELADLIPRHRLGVATRDDADDFAAQTVDLLADADRRQAIGESARRAAEEVFSWERKADALEAFYRQILNAH